MHPSSTAVRSIRFEECVHNLAQRKTGHWTCPRPLFYHSTPGLDFHVHQDTHSVTNKHPSSSPGKARELLVPSRERQDPPRSASRACSSAQVLPGSFRLSLHPRRGRSEAGTVREITHVMSRTTVSGFFGLGLAPGWNINVHGGVGGWVLMSAGS